MNLSSLHIKTTGFFAKNQEIKMHLKSSKINSSTTNYMLQKIEANLFLS